MGFLDRNLLNKLPGKQRKALLSELKKMIKSGATIAGHMKCLEGLIASELDTKPFVDLILAGSELRFTECSVCDPDLVDFGRFGTGICQECNGFPSSVGCKACGDTQICKICNGELSHTFKAWSEESPSWNSQVHHDQDF